MIRAWLKLLWNSAAIAAVAAAAQLGVAGMLGIIAWHGTEVTRTTDWNALLTWVAFSYAVAVLCGALAGRRAVARPDRAESVAARVVATLLAALGAGVAIGLAWISAGDAVAAPVRVNPPLVVAITAGAGAVVGIVVSLVALSAPPVAAGLRITIAWLWLVAAGCAVAGILSDKPHPAPRLGVLDVPSLLTPNQWTGPRLMIVVSAVVAFLIAGIARWAGAGRFGVALAGFGGPALVAAAYLVAGPGEGADRAYQFDPYLASLIATGAGLVASVLVAMPGRRGAGARPKTAPGTPQDDGRPLFGDLIAPEPPPMPASFASPRPSYLDVPVEDARRAMDYPTSEQPRVPAQAPGRTYGATTYGGSASGPAPASAGMIGQPGDDLHASWLRGQSSPGRHSADRPG